MPYTATRIGTSYCGKDNVHVASGTCEFCHRYVNLENFHSTLYFVFAFLPIIPWQRSASSTGVRPAPATIPYP